MEILTSFFRIIFLIGIGLRLAIVGYGEFKTLWLFGYISYTVHSVFAIFIVLRKYIFSRRIFTAIFAIDVVYISMFCFLTGQVDSDFYLFYFLPLLFVLEHFEIRQMLWALAYTALMIALTVFGSLGLAVQTEAMPFVQSVLPRWAVFSGLILLLYVQIERIKRQSSELEAVRLTAMGISLGEGLQGRLDVLAHTAADLLEAQGGLIYLAEGGKLKLAAVGGMETEGIKEGYVPPAGAGSPAWVFENRKPLLINDYPGSEYALPELASICGAAVEVPLIISGEVLGVLGVFDEPGRIFSKELDLPTLQSLAIYASLAIRDAMK
jgi:hypothetical protein